MDKGQIVEKIDGALLVRKKESEKMIAELETKFMDQIAKQIKIQEHLFIKGLRDTENNIPESMDCAICKGLVHKP